MTLELPKPVAAYFTADKAGAEAVSGCFTENAVVKDEAHTYQGRAAIKQWKTDVSAKYQYTCEPLACERKDGKIVVTSSFSASAPRPSACKTELRGRRAGRRRRCRVCV
jgi:hypothetical protein